MVDIQVSDICCVALLCAKLPMALTPDLAAEILAACELGASEASGALSRSLDGKLTLTPGEIQTFAAAKLAGRGLLVVLKLGTEAAVVVLEDSTGLLPAWYSAPDATGISKLATLAQELGMLVLPESCMPDDSLALSVQDIPVALTRAGLAADATAVSLQIESETTGGNAWIVWPVPQPAALADPPPVKVAAPAAPPAPEPTRRPTLTVRSDDLEEALPSMPNYTRSLLKIRVPIVVTLAKTHQPLSRIVELAPGSIIPFDKSCDDTLSLEVNNREVAVGEAVKVGDKFGLRITSMILPPERFVPLKGQR
jgi:flagellar motor switch/type III secretory pathway protein FliN